MKEQYAGAVPSQFTVAHDLHVDWCLAEKQLNDGALFRPLKVLC
tara:strand:- start:3535 stop:3666 length:132 start_codon:yes stop_codon:yes gene_type:complete